MLRKYLDSIHPYFIKGGKLAKFHAIYEMIDSFIYTPGEVSAGSTHVRDALDLKRMMSMVVVAMLPCIFMAIYNTGLQGNTALLLLEKTTLLGWRGVLFSALGLEVNPQSFISNFLHGALYFIPVYLVTNVVGGFWEVLFATVRKHEVSEGLLVTGFLFPLILPPSIPLWQVALGISFGIVFGKEIYGGTGKNFLNPALLARAFLFFAYPVQISGTNVWTTADGLSGATSIGPWTDGFSGATALTQAAEGGMSAITTSWSDAFFGVIPGSMGETSTLACLLGAFFLIVTGIGPWRIMLSTVIGMVVLSLILNMIGSDSNPMFAMTPQWHLVLGGAAFGIVFMATDPVSAACTLPGQYLYGFLIGIMIILIRVVNPAFPEGTMLAILFANTVAPLIDYFFMSKNMARRELRNDQ